MLFNSYKLDSCNILYINDYKLHNPEEPHNYKMQTRIKNKIIPKNSNSSTYINSKDTQ